MPSAAMLGLRAGAAEWRLAMNLDFSVYTWVHVIISLIGIVTGFVVIKGMLASQRMNDWTAVFLGTTALTSLTGFGFPFEKILPSHIFGVISMVVLLIAILARYAFGLEGRWRSAYVVTALIAQWLNVFVLMAQLFNKVKVLQPLAPTQSEPPFLGAQTVVMILFIFIGIAALRHFRPAPE
jgi:hypothetical protein